MFEREVYRKGIAGYTFVFYTRASPSYQGQHHRLRNSTDGTRIPTRASRRYHRLLYNDNTQELLKPRNDVRATQGRGTMGVESKLKGGEGTHVSNDGTKVFIHLQPARR